eukprot:NODE_607_length_1507_cov_61.542524_g448_i0.p1 GENE.NODE_607_length_1507_cov_61.542524_g448_i0~~NODE_607_length_1507_cov_61.542524_g448_i0.p1  ORF type:complete len:283 (+),score=87.83 NODE_607_length_1507_cov_61.542524_g448_i0:60-851(+)
MSEVEQLCIAARGAAHTMGMLPGHVRQKAIAGMVAALEDAKAGVMDANRRDLEAAATAGLTGPMLQRLTVDDKVFNYMKTRLLEVSQLPDPVGRVLEGHTNPQNLRVQKVSVPLGVVGIIYESRPNVTTDAAAVCLKSGNAVVLRGGSEAVHTNKALADAMQKAAVANGLPKAAVQYVDAVGHEAVKELLQMDKYIDVIIPRGGKGLIQSVAEGTRIPTIKHYNGVCHQYLATDAQVQRACDIVLNSKMQSVEVMWMLVSVPP